MFLHAETFYRLHFGGQKNRKGSQEVLLRRALYKVLKLRSKGDNSYTFECKDLDTKESREFQFEMTGLLEAADRAFSIMKSPKDIFFLDLDDNGKWKIVTEDQLKLVRWRVQ